ncbi:TPA: DUF2931 family protein [Photobacterium damselae]|uniref:DUF2931 family protein n=1 Tax=Photobacterium damselae TaxID=38293 RepID=UPI00406966E9
MKKINSLALIALSLMSTACTSSPRSGDTNWAVRVSQSYAYPLSAGAYGIYFDEKRPQFMMGGTTNDTRKKIENRSFGTLRKINAPSKPYDWIGTPLADFLNQTVLSPTTLNPYIPDAIVVTWYWDYNFRQYLTYFVLSDKAKKLMVMPQKVINNGREDSCYQNDITFAMLPNGEANVWITGCNKLTYVGMVSPGKPPQNIMNIIDTVSHDFKYKATTDYANPLPDLKRSIKKEVSSRLKEVGLTPNDIPPANKISTYYNLISCEGIPRYVVTQPLSKIDLQKVSSEMVNIDLFFDSVLRCKK